MENLRPYRPVAYGAVDQTTKTEEYVKNEKQCNNETFAFYIVLYTNMFLTQRIQEEYDRIKNDPWYFGRVKTAYENFLSGAKSYNRQINKYIIKTWGMDMLSGFVDMFDSVDTDVMPKYRALEQAILDVFNKENNLPDAVNLSIVYTLSAMVAVAEETRLAFGRQVPAIFEGNGKKYLSLDTLIERSDTLCLETSKRTLVGRDIDLNKQLTVRSKKNTLKMAFRDRTVFAKAFVAGGFGELRH